MEKTSIRKVYRRSSAIPVSNRLTVRWSFEGGTAPVIGAPFSATGTVQSAMTYRDGNRANGGKAGNDFGLEILAGQVEQRTVGANRSHV